jgi:hypothetical protein
MSRYGSTPDSQAAPQRRDRRRGNPGCPYGIVRWFRARTVLCLESRPALLRNHDGWSVDVAGRRERHNGGVDDPDAEESGYTPLGCRRIIISRHWYPFSPRPDGFARNRLRAKMRGEHNLAPLCLLQTRCGSRHHHRCSEPGPFQRGTRVRQGRSFHDAHIFDGCVCSLGLYCHTIFRQCRICHQRQLREQRGYRTVSTLTRAQARGRSPVCLAMVMVLYPRTTLLLRPVRSVNSAVSRSTARQPDAWSM